MSDLLEERARATREELHWLMAASPLEPGQVKARYSALERSFTKVLRIDKFMEQKAAEKKARQEGVS